MSDQQVNSRVDLGSCSRDRKAAMKQTLVHGRPEFARTQRKRSRGGRQRPLSVGLHPITNGLGSEATKAHPADSVSSPAELVGVAVGLPEHPVERGVVVVRAEEGAVVIPQGFPDEGDLLLGARLLDDDVSVALRHEAGESLELRGATEGRLESPPLHLGCNDARRKR